MIPSRNAKLRRPVKVITYTPRPRAPACVVEGAVAVALVAAPKPVKAEGPKPRTCKKVKGGCGVKFKPARLEQVACGLACAQSMARAKREQDEARRLREERTKDRAAREEMKSLQQLLNEAQTEFNRWVRFRDLLAGQGCIDCGRPFELQKLGGSMDAGHYMSRGHAAQLRFDERNVHGQRKNCNRPGGTTRAAFRAGMVERIGAEAVEALERDSTVRKWTRGEVREIRDTYRARANVLEKMLKAS